LSATIRSRENPRVKRWLKLTADSSFRRAEKSLLVDGPHLVAEALSAGLEPLVLIASESGLQRAEVRQVLRQRTAVVLADPIFKAVVDAENPPGIAAEIGLPDIRVDTARAAVFLEGIQDPSNVGAIVRSAAAFGVGEVVLDRACADAWSPKALRAGQGGHFKLGLRHVPDLETLLEGFAGTLVGAVVADGVPLRQVPLTGRVGWLFGSEGKGLSEQVARHANLRVTIPMAHGTESLNVAAAAAICLYEAFTRKELRP
jgi:TrmH family RNA methyltransferase